MVSHPSHFQHVDWNELETTSSKVVWGKILLLNFQGWGARWPTGVVATFHAACDLPRSLRCKGPSEKWSKMTGTWLTWPIIIIIIIMDNYKYIKSIASSNTQAILTFIIFPWTGNFQPPRNPKTKVLVTWGPLQCLGAFQNHHLKR